MSKLHKRTVLKMVALSAVSIATLAACGKKEEAAPAPAAAPAAEAPAQTDPLKVGFVYVSPIGDGGWTFQHDLGRKAVQEKFGDKVETTFVESVAEGPDAERVMRDMAAQGNKLIFATSFGYQEYVQKVGPDLPDVNFQHATGYKRVDNSATYDTKTFEGAYMAGVVAGGMTKSKTIGVVASVPIPEVVRNINSFVLGAQSVDPDIKAKVVWVNSWFSPPQEAEAANSLINGGVDVLYQNTNSPAVMKTAEERGVYAFGKDGDMSAFGPKAHLGSAVIDWSPYYAKVVQDALDGKVENGQNFWWGVKEGAIDLVKISEEVPQEIKDKVAEVRQGLKDGTFQIWKGPLKDNTGKQLLADGEVADMPFITSIKFYVDGVEGTVPGSK